MKQKIRNISVYPMCVILLPFMLLAHVLLFFEWLLVCVWRICWGLDFMSYWVFIDGKWSIW